MVNLMRSLYDKIKATEMLLDDQINGMNFDSSCQNVDCKVAFYVPVYNSASSVEKTILTILNQQTNFDFCITILDDFSNDNTSSIIEKMLNNYNNLRVHRTSQNLGVVLATKLARKLSIINCNNSNYIALGSDHDCWNNKFLSNGVEELEKNREVKFYIPGIESIQFDDDFYSEFDLGGKFRDSNVRVLKGVSALRECRAGFWMYGIERKSYIHESFFYLPFEGPDQMYLYPMVYKFGVIVDSSIMIRLRKRRKSFSESKHHFSESTLTKLSLKLENAIYSRLISSVRIQYHWRKELNLSYSDQIILAFQAFLKLSKALKILTGAKLRTIKIMRFLRDELYLHSAKLSSVFLQIIYSHQVKQAERKGQQKNRIGIYVTSPGIVRLLDFFLTSILENEKVELMIIADRKSWNKKKTKEHSIYIEELKSKYKSLEIKFLPAAVSSTLRSSVMKYRMDFNRIKINEIFYNHPQLSNEKVAQARAVRNLSTRNLPKTIDVRELQNNLQTTYYNSLINKYFKTLQLDLLLFSPVVNVPEAEVVATSLRSELDTLGLVASWDNLTVKGQLLDLWDEYVVWGAGQKLQIESLHGIARNKVHVSGPYAFAHLLAARRRFSSEHLGSATGPIRLLWLCSSAFIIDSKKNKFVELDDIARMLNFLYNHKVDFKFGIRLHPNCNYSVEEALNYINSRITSHALTKNNITKKEAILKSDRAEYLNQLLNTDYTIGYATTSIVEASILGKPALAPVSKLSERSYGGLMHGRILLRANGGPVKLLKNYDELANLISQNQRVTFTPRTEFARLIGLDNENRDPIVELVEMVMSKLNKGKITNE